LDDACPEVAFGVTMGSWEGYSPTGDYTSPRNVLVFSLSKWRDFMQSEWCFDHLTLLRKTRIT